MKKLKISGLFVGALLSSQAAFAVDGTIQITGTVVASTCQLLLNNVGMSNTGSASLIFDPIGSESFSAAGALAGDTKTLAFSVINCGPTVPKNLKVDYLSIGGGAAPDGTTTVPNTSTATPVTNANIAVLNGTTIVKSGDSLPFTPNSPVMLSAQYTATAMPIVAGNYAGTIQLTMTY
ncbi:MULTISPECIES: fimbrial protein [Serratia]|uniref:fimbrial protein n=1 Tax=Serratia TaxID=613 RepID=UPI0012684327|nr:MULTISPECIES: hypothetical protein [Serratia]UAN62222.1 hypothetical protein KGP16_22065 [Serratia sp. JSRIV006]